MTNLLTNPSFEKPWCHPVEGALLNGWHHMRCPRNGEQGVPEFGIPVGWDFKWADASVVNPYWDGKDYNLFVAPEIIHLTRKDLPEHEWDDFILDGDWTLKAYKRGAWCAGFSQSIFLPKGKYRFTVRLFADLVSSYKDGKQWATDPKSGNLRFTLDDSLHSWIPLPAANLWEIPFFFNAEGNTTIGFDLLCPFALANSGFFIDNLTLELVEETPVPERGSPRVQYARTYNVIPETATREQAVAIFEEGWDRSRETTGGSYDDGGIGALDDRGVNLYGIPPNRRVEFDEFYEKYYPGVAVSFLPIPGEGAKSDWRSYLLWQQDPRWRDKRFGSSGYRPTIGEEGCYITNLAMAMRIFGLCTEATPMLVDEWLGTEGYTPGTAEALHSAIKTKLGISIRKGTVFDAVGALNRGDLVMAEVLPTSLQHFVLVVEEKPYDESYLMLDPYKNLVTSLHQQYDGVESWRILSPVEEPIPPPPPPPKPLNELLTLHLQTPVPGWLDYIATVKPAWVKLVGNFEASRDIKRASPDTKVLIRQHLSASDQGKYLRRMPYFDEQGIERIWSASHFLDRFWDAVLANAPWIDAVEGLNETIATGDEVGIEEAVDFAVRFANELAARCYNDNIEGIAACLLNTAVGNPQHGYETTLLVPAVRAAVEHRGYIGYHPYFPAHIDHAERWLAEEGLHHHMRALWSWDEIFAKHGLAPRYLFTEMGAIGMTVRPDGKPGTYDPEAGWRAALGGDLARYIRLLIRFRDMVNEWNVSHGNRAEALMLFTSGIGIGWKSFLMNEYELAVLAKALT